MVKLEGLIEEITDWIIINIDRPLSIEDVAAHSGYSKWHLQRVFTKMTGISMGMYIRDIKLSMAAQDLVSSHDKIMDISFRYGFESQQSFTRTFAKKYNSPPHKYRVLNTERHI